ncbi:hypothetical protein [Nesterenkonia muleiensis]|uniref:hypothetical protein n=1 Tax=Nesterenkonia muleiensis TaxID=2282648 RepID=UPI0013001BC1|nr:hypothetical protein [Nesterenkonia muleiensis]
MSISSGGDTGLEYRLAVPIAACMIEVAVRRGEVGDAAVAKLKQMLRGDDAAKTVIGGH